MGEKRVRIVLVCMVNSIHVARWVEQFPSEKFEFILFPSTPTYAAHPRITALQAANGNISIYPFQGRLGLYLWTMDQVLANRVRSWFLQRLLKDSKPDFVHALEFQHGAYLADLTLRKYKLDTTFIATCYGSDIFWFQRFGSHLKKIKSVLERADFYSAECERDVTLAKNYGFSGQALPTIPNAGGISEEYKKLRVLPVSQRNLIMVKGYDSWVGRGSMAIEALSLLGEALDGFEILVYSCERKTLRAIRKLDPSLRHRIAVYKKGALPHEQMMANFAEALIYVGVSESDGISTSMVEAMAMGCYPVQTSTACSSEWFTGPSEGQEINEIKVEGISNAIGQALESARNISEESWGNRRMEVLRRLDGQKIAETARGFYSKQ